MAARWLEQRSPRQPELSGPLWLAPWGWTGPGYSADACERHGLDDVRSTTASIASKHNLSCAHGPPQSNACPSNSSPKIKHHRCKQHMFERLILVGGTTAGEQRSAPAQEKMRGCCCAAHCELNQRRRHHRLQVLQVRHPPVCVGWTFPRPKRACGATHKMTGVRP